MNDVALLLSRFPLQKGADKREAKFIGLYRVGEEQGLPVYAFAPARFHATAPWRDAPEDAAEDARSAVERYGDNLPAQPDEIPHAYEVASNGEACVRCGLPSKAPIHEGRVLKAASRERKTWGRGAEDIEAMIDAVVESPLSHGGSLQSAEAILWHLHLLLYGRDFHLDSKTLERFTLWTRGVKEVWPETAEHPGAAGHFLYVLYDYEDHARWTEKASAVVASIRERFPPPHFKDVRPDED